MSSPWAESCDRVRLCSAPQLRLPWPRGTANTSDTTNTAHARAERGYNRPRSGPRVGCNWTNSNPVFRLLHALHVMRLMFVDPHLLVPDTNVIRGWYPLG